jgi:hypothetical protein
LSGGAIGQRHHNTAGDGTDYDGDDMAEDEDTINPLTAHAPEDGIEMSSSSRRGSSRIPDDDLEAGGVSSSSSRRQQQQYSTSSNKKSSQRYTSINTTEDNISDPRQEVVRFYQKYNPEKLDALDEILSRYTGREQELLDKLHRQYNISRR